MDDLVAWVVIALAGLGAWAGVFALTRSVRSWWLRWLLRSLSAVWMLLPAKIQVVEGHVAPAFIVALFEGVFRADGNPRPALTALAVASLLVVVVLLIAGVLRRVRGTPER